METRWLQVRPCSPRDKFREELQVPLTAQGYHTRPRSVTAQPFSVLPDGHFRTMSLKNQGPKDTLPSNSRLRRSRRFSLKMPFAFYSGRKTIQRNSEQELTWSHFRGENTHDGRPERSGYSGYDQRGKEPGKTPR